MSLIKQITTEPNLWEAFKPRAGAVLMPYREVAEGAITQVGHLNVHVKGGGRTITVNTCQTFPRRTTQEGSHEPRTVPLIEVQLRGPAPAKVVVKSVVHHLLYCLGYAQEVGDSLIDLQVLKELEKKLRQAAVDSQTTAHYNDRSRSYHLTWLKLPPDVGDAPPVLERLAWWQADSDLTSLSAGDWGASILRVGGLSRGFLVTLTHKGHRCFTALADTKEVGVTLVETYLAEFGGYPLYEHEADAEFVRLYLDPIPYKNHFPELRGYNVPPGYSLEEDDSGEPGALIQEYNADYEEEGMDAEEEEEEEAAEEAAAAEEEDEEVRLDELTLRVKVMEQLTKPTTSMSAAMDVLSAATLDAWCSLTPHEGAAGTEIFVEVRYLHELQDNCSVRLLQGSTVKFKANFYAPGLDSLTPDRIAAMAATLLDEYVADQFKMAPFKRRVEDEAVLAMRRVWHQREVLVQRRAPRNMPPLPNSLDSLTVLGGVTMSTITEPEAVFQEMSNQPESPGTNSEAPMTNTTTPESPESPAPKTMISQVMADPTVELMLQGMGDTTKMVAAVRLQGLFQAIARKLAERMIEPQYIGILDTKAGDAFVSLCVPLAVHAVATHAPAMLGSEAGAGSKFVEASASWAFKGQMFRLGLQYAPDLSGLPNLIEGEMREIIQIGKLLSGTPEVPELTEAVAEPVREPEKARAKAK